MVFSSRCNIFWPKYLKFKAWNECNSLHSPPFSSHPNTPPPTTPRKSCTFLSFSQTFPSPNYLPPQMVPNLDLILLALLHASFISFVLLLLLFLAFISLLLSFSLALFSILLIDFHHMYSFLSQCSASLRSNLHLGSQLILLALTQLLVSFVLALKPLFLGMASKFRILVHTIKEIEAFKLAKIPGL